MRWQPTEAELRMRFFTCRTCGAQTDEPCHTVSGKPRAAHAHRFWRARDAGLLPIREPVLHE